MTIKLTISRRQSLLPEICRDERNKSLKVFDQITGSAIEVK